MRVEGTITKLETDPQQEKVTPTPTSTPYPGATDRGPSSRVCMDASTHYVHSRLSVPIAIVQKKDPPKMLKLIKKLTCYPSHKHVLRAHSYLLCARKH